MRDNNTTNHMNNLKNNNHAAIQVSLHWLFVMVVGAVILIFFLSIVMQQRRISEENQLFELRNTMNSYIEGGRGLDRGLISVSTFGAEIEYECSLIGVGCSCNLIFNNKISLNLDNNVVFAPSDLGEDNIFLSTSPWRSPYKVTNFVYLINPEERFILVYDSSDSSLKKKVEDIFYNELPDSIDKQLIPSSLREPIEFKDLNFPRRKVIIFGKLPNNVPPQLPEFANNKNTFIVNIPFVLAESDKVNFYSYNELTDRFEPETQSFYVGDSSLIGSFYIDNSQNYDCAMQKAFLNLHTVNKVMRERTKLLSGLSHCSTFYGDSQIELFDEIRKLTKDPSNWAQIDFPKLLNNFDKLKQQNNIIEGQGCPLLY